MRLAGGHLIGIILLLAVIAGFLPGCSMIEQTTGTHTYIGTTDQLKQIKAILNIPDCPPGTTAAAVGIEQATGGITVTVRCQ